MIRVARPSAPPVPADYPCVLPLGDSGFSILFGTAPDPDLNACVMGLRDQILANRAIPPLAINGSEGSALLDVVPSFCALTVHLDWTRIDPDWDFDTVRQWLLELARTVSPVPPRGREHVVPVWFGGEAGPDLQDVAARLSMPAQALIDRITALELQVHMLGFLPGLPYLAPVSEALALPRRIEPRLRVPARSVAIAGTMSVIYPVESPGGWHIIGRTPWELFDWEAPDPVRFQPGDRVRYRAVSEEDYASLRAGQSHRIASDRL